DGPGAEDRLRSRPERHRHPDRLRTHVRGEHRLPHDEAVAVGCGRRRFVRAGHGLRDRGPDHGAALGAIGLEHLVDLGAPSHVLSHSLDPLRGLPRRSRVAPFGVAADRLLGPGHRPLREPSDRLEVGGVVARLAPSAERHDDRGDAGDAPPVDGGVVRFLCRGAGVASPAGVDPRSGGGARMTYALVAYAATAILWIAYLLWLSRRVARARGE